MFSGADYGDVPAWIGAIGTTGAFAAAIWTVWDSTNKNRAERKRNQIERSEARAEREANERAQALLVTTSFIPWGRNVRVRIENHSDSPIFDVSLIAMGSSSGDLQFFYIDDEEIQKGVWSTHTYQWTVIPPREEVITSVRAHSRTESAETVGALYAMDQDELRDVEAEIEFLDSNGIYWTRQGMNAPKRSRELPASMSTPTFDAPPIERYY